MISLFTIQTTLAQNNVISFMWSETGGIQSGKFGTPTALDLNENFYRSGHVTQAQGGTDVKLQKFNNEGILQWDVTLNTSGPELYQPAKLIYDNSGLYLIGTVRSSATAPSDIFVSKVEDDGTVQYFEVNATTSDDIPADLLFDAPNDVLYLCGTTNRNGSYDVLLSAYDPNGSEMWSSTRDHNANMDGAAKISMNGTDLVLNGSSQSSPVNWDIVSWVFDDGGQYLSEERNTGIIAASEQLSDGALHNGFLQLTGHTYQGNQSDFKVVCLDGNNNVLWQDSYDKNGADDQGTALFPLSNGFVATGFVTNTNGDEDILLRKYDLSGNLLLSAEYDQDGGNDRGIDILEDDQGNYLVLNDVTVDGQKDVYLYYIEGVSGAKIWEEKIGDDPSLNETAISLESTLDGEVYITYQSGGASSTEVYSYREVSFINDPEPVSNSVLYIHSGGQVIDDNNQSVEDIKYYSFGLFPDHYFADDHFSMALNNYSWDGVANDQQQRIDVSFLNANTKLKVGQVEETQRESLFNYYIDNDKYEGKQSFDVLAYADVYNNIDAFIYSNSEGFKMTFVLDAGADINDIELNIAGASGLSIKGNDLQIQTIADDITWLKPYSYNTTVTPNGDGCVEYALSEGKLKFTTECDVPYPYIIQVKLGAATTVAAAAIENLEWSTFYGGNGGDIAQDLDVDEATGDLYVTGYTNASKFPSGSGVNDMNLYPGRNTGLVVKFNHDGVLQWATEIAATDVQIKSKAIKLYNNWGTNDKEAHIVGEFLAFQQGTSTATLSPEINPALNPPLSTNSWQQNSPPKLNENELFFASFTNNGVRMIISPFGGPQEEMVYDMDIDNNGRMYFCGSTRYGNTSGASQSPPTTHDFPIYDPGDGSYFSNSHPGTGKKRGFVAALNLNTYLLDYCSVISKDASSSNSSYEAVYALEIRENKGGFCGKGTAAARLGLFDTSIRIFADKLDQLQGNSDWPDKLYFSGITHTNEGTVFIGYDDDGADPLVTTPTASQTFQSTSGNAYMVMIDENPNTPLLAWDSYYGDQSIQDWYWHRTTSSSPGNSSFPIVHGKGKLTYSNSKFTFFAAATASKSPVQTLAHPGFFNEAIITTQTGTDGDLYLSSFYNKGASYTAEQTWGTVYGYDNTAQSAVLHLGESGSEFLSNLKAYDYNGKSYVVTLATGFNGKGSLSSHPDKYPVAQLPAPGSWFRQNITTKVGNSATVAVYCDFAISRFEITDIAQGSISLPEEVRSDASPLQLFPVPSRNVVWARLKDNSPVDHIEVVDISGKQIIYQINKQGATQVEIDISGIRPGVYFIKVNNTYHGRIVKN